jgi:hypothetical protein
MSALLPAAFYGLKVPPGDIAVEAVCADDIFEYLLTLHRM